MLVRTFLYRPRCFRKAPAPRSALRPKRVTLRATQGFATTGVRELIHQEVGPNQKIKRGQITLTESRTSDFFRNLPKCFSLRSFWRDLWLFGSVYRQGGSTSTSGQGSMALAM